MRPVIGPLLRMVKISPANLLTTQILQFLYENGAFAWRQNTGGIFDTRRGVYRTAAKKGISDVLACYKGTLIAIEIKIGKDRLSDEQEGFLRNIEAVGGKTFVAKDFESFKEWWLSTYPH